MKGRARLASRQMRRLVQNIFRNVQLPWHQVMACALAVTLLLPGGMLPCASGGCANGRGKNNTHPSLLRKSDSQSTRVVFNRSDSQSAGGSCCDRRKSTEQSPDSPSPPCDCPPECPAACGGGKIPCVTTSFPLSFEDAIVRSHRAEPIDQDLPNRTLDGIFRPPRI